MDIFKSKTWKNGIMGLVVADALGVPVEFSDRTERKSDPVIDMREYGTYNQPRGTWSDDSSLTIATYISIRETKSVNYTDIMKRFADYYIYGAYTPFDELFDIGNATAKAIQNSINGMNPIEAGGRSEWDNGNGSIMRILPICIYLIEEEMIQENEALTVIHNTSALTHGHLRSQIACGIYYYLCKSIIRENTSLLERMQLGIDRAFSFYEKNLINLNELELFSRIHNLKEFKKFDDKSIKSTGYVIDTLEAAIWCLLNSFSYKEATLMAVNLGGDTDTVGAVVGGLAGLNYGFDSIPQNWVNSIQKKNWLLELLE